MSGAQKKEPPSWLDQAFLENVFKKSFKSDDLKILDLDMKLATAAAENYASQMLRVNLVFKRNKQSNKETLSVITKLVNPGLTGKELANLQVYEKEADVFAAVLPVIDALLKKAYPGHNKLWADCYYHQTHPNFILILEDLRVRGFTLASRFEGLDMEHTFFALRSLAKLHAASIMWSQQCPDKPDFYHKTFWNNEKAAFLKNTLCTPFEILSEDVLQWTELENKEIISKKLKCIAENVADRVCKMWELDNSKLNVLLHGDAWLNNFMFRYDANGKLIEINFVDFQMMSMNSPAMELQYFIATSVSPNLRYNHVDTFLQVYYETFEETVKKLGLQLDKPFSLEHLKKDFEEKYFWGLVIFCVVYPILIVPASEAFDPDECIKGEVTESYSRAYKKKSLREILIRGFKYFEEKGAW